MSAAAPSSSTALDALLPRARRRNVFVSLLNGMQQRGDGGVLYVEAEHDRCAYRFAHEFVDQRFARALEDVLREESNREAAFVVVRQGMELHTLRFSKEDVYHGAVESTADPAAAAAAPGADGDDDDDPPRLEEVVDGDVS